MNRLYSLILCLFMATGCMAQVRPPTVSFHADTGFTAPERTCLEDSAKQWEDQTSGLVQFEYIYDYQTSNPLSVFSNMVNNRVVRWTSNTPLVVEMERQQTEDPAEPYTLLGMVTPSGGIHNSAFKSVEMRLIADRLTDPNICKLTAVHELGHILGLKHIESNVQNIMYPSVLPTRKACLKKDDLLFFCYLNDCANVEMKPCDE